LVGHPRVTSHLKREEEANFEGFPRD